MWRLALKLRQDDDRSTVNTDKMRRQAERAVADSRPPSRLTIVDVPPAWRPFVNAGRQLEATMTAALRDVAQALAVKR